MHTVLTRVRRSYGEHPLHLVILLACFALAGYTALRAATDPAWPAMLTWFVVAVVAHDLVLFPLYALADRSAASLSGLLRRRHHGGAAPRVPVVNYVRLPVLGTALTLLLFLPGIIQQGAFTYHSATGLTQQPFLQRWLLLCTAMFGVSAVVYAIRLYVAGAPLRLALRPVRAVVGRGERILAVAAGPDGPVGAVASSHAIYCPADNRPGMWSRTAWPDLTDIEWHAPDSVLVLMPRADADWTARPLQVNAPDELLRVARDLIAAHADATTAPAGSRRPMIGPVGAGALAGLLSGVVVGAVTAYHGMSAVGGNVAVGLVGYGVQAALVGVAIGLTAGRAWLGPAAVVSGGVLLGGLGWLLFPLSVVPLLHGHAPTWSAAAAVVAYPDLVRDVLHGGLTGVLLSASLAVGVIRPRVGRSDRLPRGSRVVIIGGGFAGISAARRFERLAVRGAPVDVTIVSNSNFLLFTPMLAEAAAGALEARHISAPIRSAVAHTRFRYGTVRGIDAEQRVVRIDGGPGGDGETLPYDHLVLASGSVAHTFGVPGVDKHAWTLKDLTDATRLRDHVLELLERAEQEPDQRQRAESLTFVVAGAGFAGTELIAELFDLVHGVARFYPGIGERDARFLLVHPGDRILPELSEPLAGYAQRRLSARGIDIRLGLRVAEATRHGVMLSDDEWIPTRTLVWTAGNQPSSLGGDLAAAGADTLTTDPTLRVLGVDRVWAAGDCARIPDPDRAGTSYPPTAQHAIRQGRAVADNIVAVLEGREPVEFRFRAIGVLVALGRHTAVGDIRGRQFAGLAAWLLWRGVYLAKLPGAEKRLRVLLDWLLDLVFARDIVVTTPRATIADPTGTAMPESEVRQP